MIGLIRFLLGQKLAAITPLFVVLIGVLIPVGERILGLAICVAKHGPNYLVQSLLIVLAKWLLPYLRHPELLSSGLFDSSVALLVFNCVQQAGVKAH